MELGHLYLDLTTRENAMMSDSEFKDFIQRLHELSAKDGDIGHEYWTWVIRQLYEMRVTALRAAPPEQ